MKKSLILSAAFVSFFVFTACSKTNGQKQSINKEKNQNYTIKYALNHYSSYEDFLDDNHPIQWALSEKTYVLKGDGSSKHAGGWSFKTTKGNMIESGHERGKIDYIVTTDNKDVTTIGAIKKAFS